MAVEPGTHPSMDLLVAFAMGSMEERAAAEIVEHLNGCPTCCQAAADQSGDHFLDRLRQAQFVQTPMASASSTLNSALPLSAPSAGCASPPNLPPELANDPRYEVLREVGRGGMGVVYLAKNKVMDRLEVLKVVSEDLLYFPGAAQRFLNEIRSAAKLNHVNVVAAHSAVHFGETLAFAMEYVEGEDLEKLVQRQGPLAIVDACKYVQQAALGLQHAFEQNVVHRDIKPQNLILTRKGDEQVVKILDFGLARVALAHGEQAAHTPSGAMLGTPDYVAPEQTLDAAHADIRADIYSLGCTLYFLLTAAPPFQARSKYAVLLAHKTTQARPLNQVRPEVPKDLGAVVSKMIDKDPVRRFQTPQALVHALDPFISPVPQKKVTKWRMLLPAGGVLVTLLLIGLLELWAAGVLRLKVPEGTLVVEVNVPDADLTVDGSQVSVQWDATRKKAVLRIAPGKREIAITKDRFTVFGDRVTLIDGETQVLKAYLEPVAPEAPIPGDQRRGADRESNDNGLKMAFCWCPPGKNLPGFWIGKYEVTQAEWSSLMGSLPTHPLDKGKGDRHPIYFVSHAEAVSFCKKLTEQEQAAKRLPDGWRYDLPSDEQWEYACRAGTTTATAFGDTLDSTQANFNGDWPHNPEGGAAKGPHLGKAMPVGSYRPNAWGIYDMHGNVGEFTATPGRHRGGSWYDSGRNCCSGIYINDPPLASEHVGFRVSRVTGRMP